MGSGIDFAGDGSQDLSHGPSSTGQPEAARRGSMGPIEMVGDGAMDAGGTIDCSYPKASVPKGNDILFAGDGAEDV